MLQVYVRQLAVKAFTPKMASVLKETLRTAAFGADWMPSSTHARTAQLGLGRGKATSVGASSISASEDALSLPTSPAGSWGGSTGRPPRSNGHRLSLGSTGVRSVGAASSASGASESSAIFAARTDLLPIGARLMGKLFSRVSAALQEVPPLVRVEAERAFKRADVDKSGYIEASELQAVLSDLQGSAVSQTEAFRLLQLIGEHLLEKRRV
jgi:hypothetical protein